MCFQVKKRNIGFKRKAILSMHYADMQRLLNEEDKEKGKRFFKNENTVLVNLIKLKLMVSKSFVFSKFNNVN